MISANFLIFIIIQFISYQRLAAPDRQSCVEQISVFCRYLNFQRKGSLCSLSTFFNLLTILYFDEKPDVTFTFLSGTRCPFLDSYKICPQYSPDTFTRITKVERISKRSLFLNKLLLLNLKVIIKMKFTGVAIFIHINSS